MGKPAMVMQIAKNLDWEKLPDAAAARATSMGNHLPLPQTPATLSDAVATVESGYPIPVRGYFVLTDAHLGGAAAGGPGRRGDGHCTKSASGGRAGFQSRLFDPVFACMAGCAAGWEQVI